jgi:organic hydroperoxide reductase OsmC/OhrA
MQPYPHRYRATAIGGSLGVTQIRSPDLEPLEAAPPPEFGGPGGVWSPETLLMAAIADCFLLTFRSLARASRLQWNHLECQVEGVLERVDGQARFSRFALLAKLSVSSELELTPARSLLQRAEHGCLVSNSLAGPRTLVSEVTVGESEAETGTATVALT